MSGIAQELWRACAELGLRVDLGFCVSIPGIPEVVTIARVADLGAPNGMLVVRSYADIAAIKEVLLDAGYGFSVLDEPNPGEEFDLESFKSMFRDWGWSGDLAKKPTWLR